MSALPSHTHSNMLVLVVIKIVMYSLLRRHPIKIRAVQIKVPVRDQYQCDQTGQYWMSMCAEWDALARTVHCIIIKHHTRPHSNRHTAINEDYLCQQVNCLEKTSKKSENTTQLLPAGWSASHSAIHKYFVIDGTEMTSVLMPCWLRSTVVERQSLDSKLSLSCTQPAADGRPLLWVNRML